VRRGCWQGSRDGNVGRHESGRRGFVRTRVAARVAFRIAGMRAVLAVLAMAGRQSTLFPRVIGKRAHIADARGDALHLAEYDDERQANGEFSGDHRVPTTLE